MKFTPPTRAGYKPFWPEDHDRDQQDTEDKVSNISEREARYEMDNGILYAVKNAGWVGGTRIQLCRKKHVESVDKYRTNDHSWDTAYSTNYHHCEKDH